MRQQVIRDRNSQLFIDEMRTLGATSAATACSESELPRIARQQFDEMLRDGMLREGAPGTYYLFDTSDTRLAANGGKATFRWKRVVINLIFWIAVLLVPIAYMSWSSPRR